MQGCRYIALPVTSSACEKKGVRTHLAAPCGGNHGHHSLDVRRLRAQHGALQEAVIGEACEQALLLLAACLLEARRKEASVNLT